MKASNHLNVKCVTNPFDKKVMNAHFESVHEGKFSDSDGSLLSSDMPVCRAHVNILAMMRAKKGCVMHQVASPLDFISLFCIGHF